MTPTPRSALERLRAETRPLHDALEADLQVMARLRTPPRRAALVSGYATMLLCATELLGPWRRRVEGLVPWPGSPAGVTEDTQAESCTPRVELNGLAEVLGFYYVMQGSALGGRVMLRELEQEGVDIAGLAFLNPHGERAGEVWRETMSMLERHLDGDARMIGDAILGARKGYAFAAACLTERSGA